MGVTKPETEHVVHPQSSIVETIEWLNSHGITRAWYLHGRTGSAVIFQESYRDTLNAAQQGDLLRANYFISPPHATIVCHGPEPVWHMEPHEYEPGHTGMTCETMLTDGEGFGTNCGRTHGHPCHQRWLQAEAARSAANMIHTGGSSDPTDSAIDHGSGEAAADPAGVTIPHRGRVYVAGPMTGYPDFNYPAFRKAASDLVAWGYQVEDPSANNIPDGSPWADYMRVAIPQMLTCGAVALLPGWEASKGATLEVHIAKALGMRVLPIEEWEHAQPTRS